MTLQNAKDRGLTLTEVLALHHLPDDGLLFDETLDPAWVDGQLGLDRGPTAFHCEGGSAARLEVTPLGSMESRPPILVRGRAKAHLRSTCVRCLADVVLPLAVEIQQTLFPDVGEEQLEAQELDEGAYSNEGVDLPNVLREALLLEVAMNPTCEDVGACDERTKKLIDDVNEKNRPAVDPRWAALEKLKS